jgi:hypothetical protein
LSFKSYKTEQVRKQHVGALFLHTFFFQDLNFILLCLIILVSELGLVILETSASFFCSTQEFALPLDMQQLQTWCAVILMYLVRKLDL